MMVMTMTMLLMVIIVLIVVMTTIIVKDVMLIITMITKQPIVSCILSIRKTKPTLQQVITLSVLTLWLCNSEIF